MSDRCRDGLDTLADAADPGGCDLRGEERDVGADRRQLLQLRRIGGCGHAAGRPPEPPGRGRVRRSATEARGGRNPLLEGQADEVRLPAEAGPKAAPGEVSRIERHAGRGVAVDAEPAAPRQQDQPIGQLQQDELAVEEVKSVVATPDDPQREVQLRGGLEAERRHSGAPQRRCQAGPFLDAERLGPSLAVDAAPLERGGDGLARGRQLAHQAVVDLLAPLAEPGLHDPVERLPALTDRDDRVGTPP